MVIPFHVNVVLFLKLEGAPGGIPGERGEGTTPSSSGRDSPLFLSSSSLPPFRDLSISFLLLLSALPSLSPEFWTMGYEVDLSSVVVSLTLSSSYTLILPYMTNKEC